MWAGCILGEGVRSSRERDQARHEMCVRLQSHPAESHFAETHSFRLGTHLAEKAVLWQTVADKKIACAFSE